MMAQGQIPRRGSQGQLVNLSTNTLHRTLPSGTVLAQGQVPRIPSVGQLVDPSPNTLHYTVHSKRMHHGRKKDSWWQVAILCLPCLLVMLCFGVLPAMQRRTRIISAFVSVTVISVTVGTVLFTTNYSPYNFTATTGDQRPLYSKFSTFFCSYLDVMSQDDKVSVYYFNELPPMQQKKIAHLSVAGRSKIGPDEFEVLQFYLMEGSEIEATLKVRNHRDGIWMKGPLYDVYIIQGDTNFAAWKSNRYTRHRHSKLKLTNKTELVYNVTESDVYYFVVTDESILSSIDVTISLLLLKTQYDLSSRLKKCFSANGDVCSFFVDFGSSEIAILDIDYEYGGSTKGYNITSTCRANTMTYVLTFLAFPMIFLVLWSAMIWVCFKPMKKEPAMRPLALGREARASVCESCNCRTGRPGSRDWDFDIGLFRKPFDDHTDFKTDIYTFAQDVPFEQNVAKLTSLNNVSPTDGRGSRDLDVGSFRSSFDGSLHDRTDESATSDTYTFEQDGPSEICEEARSSSVSGVSNPLFNFTMHGESVTPFETRGAQEPLELNAARLASVSGFCNPLSGYTVMHVENEASPVSIEEQGPLELSLGRSRSLRDLPMVDDRETPSVHSEESERPPDLPLRPVRRLPSTHHLPTHFQSGLTENEEEENEVIWV